MVAETTKPRTIPGYVNRLGYIGFVIAGICFAIMGKFSDAAMFGGLSLVFDPFDQTVPFPKRPLYQRAILLAHLVFTLVFFGLALLK
jgi:hypothetical protein